MSDINTVTIVGRLVEKPVIKYSKSGTAVSNLRVANNTYAPNAAEQNKTNFFTVVVFGKQAENCEKYLDKGRQIVVNGRLDFNTWENAEGKKQSMVRIIANAVQFIGGNRPSENAETSSTASGQDEIPPSQGNQKINKAETNDTETEDFNSTFESPIDDTDDIPF